MEPEFHGIFQNHSITRVRLTNVIVQYIYAALLIVG